MHQGPLPEATQSTTVHIKFEPLISGLPSLVEAQTSAMCASTSVVFTPGPQDCTMTVALHMLHDINLREIFECVCMVHRSIHTHTCAQCSHASVGLAQAHPNYWGAGYNINHFSYNHGSAPYMQ